jgi:hypothetical protein
VAPGATDTSHPRVRGTVWPAGCVDENGSSAAHLSVRHGQEQFSTCDFVISQTKTCDFVVPRNCCCELEKDLH